MITKIIQLLLLSAVSSSVLSASVNNTVKQYAFHLAGRDFTHAEAAKLAGSEGDLQTAVRKNFAAAATIVLCSRENIELSAGQTRMFLQKSLMLMPLEAQKQFNAMLLRSNLTRDSWLDREKEKIANQLSEAVVRWYIKVFGSSSPITPEHIQNWYYRNMDIFRRIKLDPARVWAFKLADREKIQQAMAALRQAVPPEVVRKKFAEPLTAEAIAEELHSEDIKRSAIDDRYWLLTGSKHCFLITTDAVTHTALPLDDALKSAIGNALHEALAKARLAETLKKEFNGKKIVFY